MIRTGSNGVGGQPPSSGFRSTGLFQARTQQNGSGELNMIEDKDHLQRRCPRLGGRVDFKYCRCASDNGQICFKVFDCWWEIFDVKKFLAGHLPADVYRQLCEARPPQKINTILDLIAQARSASPAEKG